MKWILLLPALLGANLPRRILVATWAPQAEGKPTLLHGQTDAMDLADAFSQLGGLAASDRLMSEVQDTTQLLRAWQAASNRLDSSKGPTELVIFHTGHAVTEGILVGGQRLPWSRLRQLLSTQDGRLRVAFLDACASGQALRTKGGSFHPALEAATATGSALLTSSRGDELSTESDLDGGSLFTRALVAGLRGAADADRNGQITLSEAFRHTSQQTERRARDLGAPAQHPVGASELVGSVDPVLTDVRHPPSRLRLLPGFPSLALLDSAHVSLGTVNTGVGDTMDLALQPGLWILATDSNRATVRVLLQPNETRTVSPRELVATAPPLPPLPKLDSTRWVPINFGILPPVSINSGKPRIVHNAFSLDLILGEAKTVTGIQIAGVMARIFGDATGFQASMAGNSVAGNLRGFQFSSANQVDGHLVGAQLASYLNTVEGDLVGAQISGLMNVARGRVAGAQIGAADYAGRLDRGFQFALVTVSGQGSGVQTGLINVASHFNGAQIGVVNIGSGSGLRLGMLNVIPSGKPVSIGAISVGGDFSLHPALQLNQHLSNRLLLRSRANWFQSGLVWEGLPYLGGHRTFSIETSVRVPSLLAPEIGVAWTFAGLIPRPVPDLVAGCSWPLLSHLAPFVQGRWSLRESQGSIWMGMEF